MTILGIDTSAYNLAIAVVKDGRDVLFSISKSFFSSPYSSDGNWLDLLYELPKFHQQSLNLELDKQFKEHNISWDDIDAIAVSAYSGIYNAVLTGKIMADTWGMLYNKKVITVDHILAHHYSTWLERDTSKIYFPILVFSASRSHSDISIISGLERHETIFNSIPAEELNGSTRYIGIGRLFYDMATLLFSEDDTESPFTTLINILEQDFPYNLDFTPYYKGGLLDFDFTDFMDEIAEETRKKKQRQGFLNEVDKRNIATSFQAAISSILIEKIIYLAKIFKVKEVHLVGGLSNNNYFKETLGKKIRQQQKKIILRNPIDPKYRLDNAAMISGLAFFMKKHKIDFKNHKPIITK